VNKVHLLNRARQSAQQLSAKQVGGVSESGVDEHKAITDLQCSLSEAYCGDDIELMAKTEGMPDGTKASARIDVDGQPIAILRGEGGQQILLNWHVKDVEFRGEPLPEKKQARIAFAAGGELKTVEPDVSLMRIPDKKDQPLDLVCQNEHFRWRSRLLVEWREKTLFVHLHLQARSAWLGRWLQFDPGLDHRADWVWVQKSHGRWCFWNQGSPRGWTPLPRPIGQYTVYHKIFVQSAGEFVCRDDPNLKWPEPFQDTGAWQQAMQHWQQAITNAWDGRFVMRRKGCQSSISDCCSWPLRIIVHWHKSADGEATDTIPVDMVDSEDWERFNLRDWYIHARNSRLAAHHAGHLLGAWDEYESGAISPVNRTLTAETLMGIEFGAVEARHLAQLRERIREMINAWVGRAWEFDLSKR